MSSEFTDSVVAEFRANDGHVGGELADTPIILIHQLGARTRTERVTPLAYTSQADGRLVIAASNGGSPTHPAWYHNLKVHPTIEVELGAETFTALRRTMANAGRDVAGVARVPSQDGAANRVVRADETHPCADPHPTRSDVVQKRSLGRRSRPLALAQRSGDLLWVRRVEARPLTRGRQQSCAS
jgi:deazaflavin-dependent oxidoreductase (nitroreductase family)